MKSTTKADSNGLYEMIEFPAVIFKASGLDTITLVGKAGMISMSVHWGPPTQ
jgi:hypothetical protein